MFLGLKKQNLRKTSFSVLFCCGFSPLVEVAKGSQSGDETEHGDGALFDVLREGGDAGGVDSNVEVGLLARADPLHFPVKQRSDGAKRAALARAQPHTGILRASARHPHNLQMRRHMGMSRRALESTQTGDKGPGELVGQLSGNAAVQQHGERPLQTHGSARGGNQTKTLQQLHERSKVKMHVPRASIDKAICCQMVEEPARSAVGGVDRTHEAPRLGHEFAHSGRLHFLKIRSAMHAAKVRRIAQMIELLGQNDEAAFLLHVRAKLGQKVAGCGKGSDGRTDRGNPKGSRGDLLLEKGLGLRRQVNFRGKIRQNNSSLVVRFVYLQQNIQNKK
jgi:hypothetical protein